MRFPIIILNELYIVKSILHIVYFGKLKIDRFQLLSIGGLFRFDAVLLFLKKTLTFHEQSLALLCHTTTGVQIIVVFQIVDADLFRRELFFFYGHTYEIATEATSSAQIPRKSQCFDFFENKKHTRFSRTLK